MEVSLAISAGKSSLGPTWENATKEGTDPAQGVRAIGRRFLIGHGSHIRGGVSVSKRDSHFPGNNSILNYVLRTADRYSTCHGVLILPAVVATSPRTLPALITLMPMTSYWVTGRMELASRKRSLRLAPSGDHVKGSPSEQTEMSMHVSASGALWHVARCSLPLL